MPEDQLDGCSIIELGPRVDHVELQLADVLSDLAAGMVRCSIQEQYTVLPPRWKREVKAIDEARQEDENYILIRRSLSQ